MGEGDTKLAEPLQHITVQRARRWRERLSTPAIRAIDSTIHSSAMSRSRVLNSATTG